MVVLSCFLPIQSATTTEIINVSEATSQVEKNEETSLVCTITCQGNLAFAGDHVAMNGWQSCSKSTPTSEVPGCTQLALTPVFGYQ